MLLEDGRKRTDLTEPDESVGDLASPFDALVSSIDALITRLATSEVEVPEEPVSDAPVRGGLVSLIRRYSDRGSADGRQESHAGAREPAESRTLEPDWL
jgi:hypothetical protein